MNRYILWSIVFHIAVVLGGAGLAPMRGLITTAPRSEMIISVGLVDAPDGPAPAGDPAADPAATPPKLEAPDPALDADLALKPIADLTKEKVEPPKETEPAKKPAEEKKVEPKKETPKPETKSQSGNGTDQLASADTAGGSHGSITEGPGGGGDVWGVETGASVSPYHRRGFATIRSNWRNPAVGNKPLKCSVRFVVNRTGQIDGIELETRSGSELFDRAAMRAVQMTESWDQFPSFWPEEEQVIILDFEYRP